MWLSWFSLFRRVTRIDRQTSPGMIQTAGVQISLFFKFLIYKTGIGGTTFYLKRVPISGELKLPIRSVNAYWFYVAPITNVLAPREPVFVEACILMRKSGKRRIPMDAISINVDPVIRNIPLMISRTIIRSPDVGLKCNGQKR